MFGYGPAWKIPIDVVGGETMRPLLGPSPILDRPTVTPDSRRGPWFVQALFALDDAGVSRQRLWFAVYLVRTGRLSERL